MKRIFKIITFILAVILLCSVFTGCNALDEMKEAHATISKDRTVITYKGNKYLPITVNNAYFDPLTESEINVTEEDVPVLLSRIQNIYAGQITADGSVMSLNVDYWADYYDDNFYYCREDLYDVISAALDTEPEPDLYCYNYYGYDKDGEYIDEFYIFTEEQFNAVNEIIETQQSVYVDTQSYETDVFIFVEAATEDRLFRWESFYLYKNGDRYIIEDAIRTGQCYAVPDRYIPIFEDIVAAELGVDLFGDDIED